MAIAPNRLPKKGANSTRYKAAARILLQNALGEIGLSYCQPVYPGRRSIKIRAHFHTSNMRKDIDNLCKFVMDVLEGPVYGSNHFIVKDFGTQVL